MYRGITQTGWEKKDSIRSDTETFDSIARMSVQPVGIQSGKQLNINRYATKKTIAQGMLDIALLTANASQLRYILTMGKEHEFYEIMLGLIITSIVLQVATGLLVIVLSLLDIRKRSIQKIAENLNHLLMGINLLILSDDLIKMGFHSGFIVAKNGSRPTSNA